MDKKPVRTDPEAGLIDGQWRPGAWSGIPQLTCTLCRWDTLEGIGAAREYASKCPRCHPPEEVREPPIVFVADRWGRQRNDPVPRVQDPDEE